MKEKKDKSEKVERIVNTVAPKKRAKGTKLPLGNPTIISAKDDGAKLPTNLQPLFEKVNRAGKDGVKLNALAPKTSEGRYQRWLCRTLVTMGYLKAIGEPKTLSIAKSVRKATKSKGASNRLAHAA